MYLYNRERIFNNSTHKGVKIEVFIFYCTYILISGTKVKEGDECGALESVKAASEIYSPVSGTVTEKNVEVEKKPALINSSCYDKGWLFKLKLSQPDELKELMSEADYEKFLKTDADKDH